jgi:uncharacterized protein (UPF0335 family)
MDLLTDELASQVMDKDLRRVIDRIERFEQMHERVCLNIQNGRIEDAIGCVEEELRDLEDVKQMIDEAQTWKDTQRLMAALQAMGYDIRRVEVRRR